MSVCLAHQCAPGHQSTRRHRRPPKALLSLARERYQRIVAVREYTDRRQRRVYSQLGGRTIRFLLLDRTTHTGSTGAHAVFQLDRAVVDRSGKDVCVAKHTTVHFDFSAIVVSESLLSARLV